MDFKELLCDTPNGDITPGFKEYHNLSGYYLKLDYNQTELTLTSYNIDNLDGIKYEIKFKFIEIAKLNEFKTCNDIKEIFEVIVKYINKNNYKIYKKNNNIIFSLLIKDKNNINLFSYFLIILIHI